MKRFRILAVTLSLLVFVAMLVGCAGPETITLFPDKNLEAAVRDALDKQQADEEITADELANLTTLSAESSDITDLSGIEYCTNLTELDLSNNKISDISPLSSLTNLTVLNLNMNRISDISALSNLTNLRWLNLKDNLINNILPLVKNSGLGAGDRVFISGNNLVIEEHTEIWQYIEALEDRGVIIHHPGSW